MRTKIAVIATGAVAAAALAAGASAVGSQTSAPSALDKHYLMTSAAGDQFEIQGGKIAQSKGSSTAVKKLGATLVKDHTKSLQDLKKVAAKLGVRLPAGPTPPEKWELNQAKSQSGTAFDRVYTSLEVADHEQDIADTTEEMRSGQRAQVKALAKQDLPVLQKHLKLARAAAKV